jgi:L-arabinokinase
MVYSSHVNAHSTLPREDLEAFAHRVRRISSNGHMLRGFFDSTQSVTLARAPGRLDVMGGIADYSGSLVLELPIREAAFAAAQRAGDGYVRVASVAPGASETARELVIPVSFLESGYSAARAWFSESQGASWGAYVAGGLVALVAERGIRLSGARLLVSSTVPEGKGVASSAAVAVAAFLAASVELGVSLAPEDVALSCQRVENFVAGAPSGVMDPMAVALGNEEELLELICQPAVVRGHVAVPTGVRLFGVDSGVRHAISGADYGLVRVAAFMGYRMLAELEGLSSRIEQGRVVVDDGKFGGYLANVPSDLALRHRRELPERLEGTEFLRRFGGTTDPVTRVDPARTYPVRAATLHPVFEHERVRAFAAALPHAPDEQTLRMLGTLMRDSHASYSACGLGSDGTDLLVELVEKAPDAEGLYGAKITGGGSGGTVAVLARAGADAAVERIAREYGSRTGRETHVFAGSSPGAAVFGAHRLDPGGALVRV